MPTRPLISVVFSFRNEQEVLPELLRRLQAVFETIDTDYELIFVDDASTDASNALLLRHAEVDARIRVIAMSARFGVNPCFLAGMREARGDAVITMDTDLQDPPEIIPELVREWRAGFDVVHATRTERLGESRIKLLVTRAAYRVLRAIADFDLPMDTGMFKLMSRIVVDEVCKTGERDPFLRGLITWVGFNQTQINYRREARHAGRTHFPLLSRGPAHEFLLGFVSSSTRPLTLALLLGLAILAIAGAATLAGIAALTLGTPPPWIYWAFLLLTLLCALQSIALGILGLYVARIYHQVQGRPPYIIANPTQTHSLPQKNERNSAA